MSILERVFGIRNLRPDVKEKVNIIGSLKGPLTAVPPWGIKFVHSLSSGLNRIGIHTSAS